MLKRTILALAAAALTFTGVAQAQENATLTLRSGEKISLSSSILAARASTSGSTARKRQIPTNDVAVIDFTGGSMTDADWAKVPERPADRVAEERRHRQRPALRHRRHVASEDHVKTASGEREFSSE